jgi:hypothetical protein
MTFASAGWVVTTCSGFFELSGLGLINAVALFDYAAHTTERFQVLLDSGGAFRHKCRT